MRLPNFNRKVSGFTLVEMAIVLVIIGIILAGVMKGRDIVRGAQVKQWSQQFAQKWGTVAQTYYDKTGQQLNDGTINGGNAAILAGAQDGVMDGTAGTRAYTGAAPFGIEDVLNNVGISPCTMIKSKLILPSGAPVSGTVVAHCNAGGTQVVNIFQSLVEGEYVGSQTVSVDLVGTNVVAGGKTYLRNLVVLYNVPADVAIGLDTAIDGTANGAAGSCLNLGAGVGAGVAQQGYAPGVGSGAVVAINSTWNSKAWPQAEVNPPNRRCTTVAIVLDY